ncbi:DNA polymerase/3'-5' exonuclease PolX [Marinigracilibium pacificum]|uniref:DNA polymerase/3'-5' exonuclease PolX n=1 Tax=Marinigracilibium pacificum TaxID=2729599 RepID=A0A848IYX6_9BACT|nr:DNA polymerase/3'-5' exonuclease PolX [Marinigracilibium pacificum]NMM49477.1 DNA polymerase/3'-5' exonuclease PolX [Marinigracilibium pacificum]
MDNKTIIKLLKQAADLMELHGENPFKVRGYSNAAFKLERFEGTLSDMSADEIAGIDGVGKSIVEAISEAKQNGSFTQLDDLISKTPEGVLNMMEVKGIGPKKIAALWHDEGIDSVDKLLKAAEEGKLSKMKGFGAKTEEKIIEQIMYMRSNEGKLHYAAVIELNNQVCQELKTILNTDKVSDTGALRRKMPVIEKLSYVVGVEDPDLWESKLSENKKFSFSEEESGPFAMRGIHSESGMQIEIFYSSEKRFINRLFETTGSPLHLNFRLNDGETLFNINRTGTFKSETEIYETAGLPYIEPECREGQFEFEWSQDENRNNLLTEQSVKGILHAHSTYSDGKNTLREMAEDCMKRGYEYLGITDHSKTAGYANGLQENRIKKQWEEIDKLNEELAPFKIFKGIESDILTDGSLDYENDILSGFDFIVASIHSPLNMDKAKATNRLITAIKNPYTTILGHPTGRLLLRREGYPIDHKAVIDAAAENNVVIEINANPWRLDLDWMWVRYAIEKGVRLSINPDAHELAGYDHVKFGVIVGRKGGLTENMNLNSLGVNELAKYFEERKSKI